MVRALLTVADNETAIGEAAIEEAAIGKAVIWPMLIAWAKGQEPSSAQFDQLVTWTLNRQELAVWQLPVASVKSVLSARATLMQAFCARLDSGELRLAIAGHWADWIVLLWTLWLPLAERIHRQQQLGESSGQRVFVQGILGAQGTGKTTLTQILGLILDCLGQCSISLSIDDLYLSYAERCELRRQDPRLVWRGPPGTHDVKLGVKTLSELKRCEEHQSVLVPQFDKSLHGGAGDLTQSKVVRSPTIVLFEGWFIGTQPLPVDMISRLDFPFPEPIVSAEDKQFARDCNRQLVEYLPLWALVDDLMVLQPQDYRFSLQWRQAAERKMIAQHIQTPTIQKDGQKGGMDDEQISEFVRYFWKALHPELFISPLTVSHATSLVVSLDCAHQLNNLCLP